MVDGRAVQVIEKQIKAFREWFFAEIEKTAHMWDDFKIVPVKDL